MEVARSYLNITEENWKRFQKKKKKKEEENRPNETFIYTSPLYEYPKGVRKLSIENFLFFFFENYKITFIDNSVYLYYFSQLLYIDTSV